MCGIVMTRRGTCMSPKQISFYDTSSKKKLRNDRIL